MKKVRITILSLFISGAVIAQNADIDERLLERFSEKELEKMVENDQDSYEFELFVLNNCYSVYNFEEGKGSENFVFLEEDVDLSDLNVFKWVYPEENANSYLVTKDRKNVIIIKPLKMLREEFNERQREK